MTAEERARELQLAIPDFTVTPYTGLRYGTLRSHRQVDTILFLSGHLPELPDGTLVHPGTVGDTITVEQGYEAARAAGLNVLAGIRYAVGSLDRVAALVGTVNFVVCSPSYPEIHRVTSGCTDLLLEVFGPDIGLGGRTTVGVSSLARGHCFETVATFQIAPGGGGPAQTA